jgi:hypothetical protein
MPRTSTSAKIQSAVAAAIAAKEAELVATATKPEKKYIGKASFHVEGLLMADANIIFTESQFNGGEISLVTIRPSTMAADAKLQVAAITKKDANTVVMSENEITAVLGAAGALSYYGAAVINGKPSTWLHLIKDPKMTVADSDFAGAVNTNMWDEMADADGVLRFTTPLTGKIVSEISRPAFPGWWGLRIVENRIKVVEMTAETGKDESYRRLFHRHLAYMIEGQGYHLHTGSFVSKKDAKVRSRMAVKASQLRERLAMTDVEAAKSKHASYAKVVARQQERRQTQTGIALGLVNDVQKVDGKVVSTAKAVAIMLDGQMVDATKLNGRFDVYRKNGNGAFVKTIVLNGANAYDLRTFQTYANVNGFGLKTPGARG